MSGRHPGSAAVAGTDAPGSSVSCGDLAPPLGHLTRDGGARDRAAAPAVSGAHNRAGRPPDRGGRRGRRAARSARWPRWTGPGRSRCRAEDLLRQLVERKLQVPAKARWLLATPDERTRAAYGRAVGQFPVWCEA